MRIRAAQADGAPIELRGRNRVEGVAPGEGGVRLDIATPEGAYGLSADWVVAADGAGSATRRQLGLGFEGKVFQDNFLIADVRMAGDFPTERWFWFDPPFKGAGASALLHKQPGGIWRIDFQIGWNVDRQAELAEDRVRARLDAMLGPACEYEIVWTSIYAFQCRRLTRFRHDRVIFIGDAAHQVSPFGARGANSGLQDAENLAWKLAMVVRGEAPEGLLDTYQAERLPAADENIAHSTRSTDFISPHSPGSRVLRNAVLALAERHDFARPLVNSGRLSVPAVYDPSPLNGEDALPGGPARARPGAPCPDAPCPGVPHPDAPRADAPRADVPCPDAPCAGVPYPGAPRADALSPGVPHPDAPRSDALRADVPCPDAPCAGVPLGETYLLDRLGAGFTLLTIDAPGGVIGDGAAIAEAFGLAHVAVEAGALPMLDARYLGQAPGAAYLIRPDQHVAARWARLEPARVGAALARARGRLES